MSNFNKSFYNISSIEKSNIITLPWNIIFERLKIVWLTLIVVKIRIQGFFNVHELRYFYNEYLELYQMLFYVILLFI
jgi:hypothetical protein